MPAASAPARVSELSVSYDPFCPDKDAGSFQLKGCDSYCNKIKAIRFGSECMYGQAAAELRFKPGGFGRHDISGIRNGDQLLHGNGIEGKGCYHLSRIHPLF